MGAVYFTDFFLFLCTFKSNISTHPERTETADRVNSLTGSAPKLDQQAGTQVHVLACQTTAVVYAHCEAAWMGLWVDMHAFLFLSHY